MGRIALLIFFYCSLAMSLSFRRLLKVRKEASTIALTSQRATSSFRGGNSNSEKKSWNSRDGDHNGGDYARKSEKFWSKNIIPRREMGEHGFPNNYRRLDTSIKKEPEYGHYYGDHLYGITPVKLALKAKRRKISELLLQNDMDVENKKDSSGATDILVLAKEQNIPVHYVSKHDLNMISDNRPHQGFILRAEPLEFVKINTLDTTESYKVVLALDEVWDPQNFGALLRTSYFLGIDKVVVSAKNSAPLSATVSKASSGALELMEVHSTDNMMKFLDGSKANGWQVVGTALSNNAVTIDQLPIQKPIVLVLGNEGHGVRTNVIRRCDNLVKIAKHTYDDVETDGVDSLNVSVTGGILMHYLLSK